jgi:Fe-S cluster assembly protein SufD
VESRPELEIHADDVQCSHGSTTGQLDPAQIFFLRSRGIGEETARALLTYAFASEVLDRMELEPLRQTLSAELRRRLPRGETIEASL